MAKTSESPIVHMIRRLTEDHCVKNLPDQELLRRFTSAQDDAAFAALVRRHGPMVLDVCCNVVGNEADAEDAFQATFLVLARKAKSIRNTASVGSWLHGVAYRTALHGRKEFARRRKHESHAPHSRGQESTGDPPWSEVQQLMHAELTAVSDPYRAPWCSVSSKAGPRMKPRNICKYRKPRCERAWNAAGRFCACPRLLRRGLGPTALLAACSWPAATVSACLPRALLSATVKAGTAFVCGQATAGLVSGEVAVLVASALKATLATKLKIVTTVLLALALVPTLGGWAFQARPAKDVAGEGALGETTLKRAALRKSLPPASARNAKPSAEEATQPTAGDEMDDSVEVTGRVVDPMGKPFSKAKVFFVRHAGAGHIYAKALSHVVTSDADGHFRVRVSQTGYKDDNEKRQWMRGSIIALGNGYGFGWIAEDDAEKLKNVTVKLVKAVPIEGRVIDLEGKPIEGVSVDLRRIDFLDKGGSLIDFVRAGKAKEGRFGGFSWPALMMEPVMLGLQPTTVTSADGKFRFLGISGECVVRLRFEGPTIETADVNAMTRPGPTVHEPANKNLPFSRAVSYHGSRFEHAAAPTGIVEGIVRDIDTGKPLAGIYVSNNSAGPGKGIFLSVRTDREGRYRIVGLSRDAGQSLEVTAPDELPYLGAGLTVKEAFGATPVKLDFNLKRGVVIRGHIINKVTGRPVPARVTYFAFNDNPTVREVPGFRDSRDFLMARSLNKDGSFSVLALPGRGLVAASAADLKDQSHYLMGVGADKIRGLEPNSCNTHPFCCDAACYNVLMEVNPAKGVESIERDILFDPGKTVTGVIVGPDGKQMTGASIQSVFGVWFDVKDLPNANFSIPGIDPNHPRAFYFRSRDRKLGAAVLLKGDEPMPVTIRLEKCATIIGRLVDEDGLPCAATLSGHIHKGQLNINSGVGAFTGVADKDGRFRIEGVIPGLKVGIWAGKNFTYFDQHLVEELIPQVGEVKDLGDLQRKVME